MEPNNLISGLTINLSNRGLPEEQIRRAITGLEPGERVFVYCSNISPTRPMPGLEGISYSYWYNPALVYVWLTSNNRVRNLWKTEHRILDQGFKGGTK
jgi:hypothetical protein